jgi:pyruvate-ferredoxin/flavodoxin oxidoreductase
MTDDDLRALVDDEAVWALRARGLTPDAPVLRGSAQNPDVFFQAREAAGPFHAAVPGIVQDAMDRLAERTGRRYGLIDYVGSPEAERVVVLMGSGAGAARETVDALTERGERVGLAIVHLFRPFPLDALREALPAAVRRIAVLDRTKEPGAPGEPLYQDVVTALAETAGGRPNGVPAVTGGRYGLSSKEFTPAMVKAVFDDLNGADPRNHFTVGIVDDVGHTSLPVDPSFSTEPEGVRAVFYGLGSDGTVGATRTSVKIIGEEAGLFAQGYFVYDSKKSGTVTVSHLRFGPRPITSTYLIREADFVACHQFNFLERIDVLREAAPGATFLLNSPFGPAEAWDRLPVEVQRTIVDKHLDLWVIDAYGVARDAGLGLRINTVMQTCFFALSGVLPREQAIETIKRWVETTYGKRGHEVVERNWTAIDAALAHLHHVDAIGEATGPRHRRPPLPADAPDFVQRVTARMLEGEGDLLPVSALPVDGTFPTGTSRWEKRDIAQEIPIWDPSICIDCGKCALACPHAAVRMQVFAPEALDGAPDGFRSKEFVSRELPGMRLAIQVAPDDCTGCGVCVDVCPVKSKHEVKHKALNMEPAGNHRERERASFDFFLGIPPLRDERLPVDTIKGSQTRQPLFEFSGACAGCGETPYLKLLTQLFGDRIIVANATGCSSIYGGNLPTTPWATNDEGRGPAWANSLFEDNAEFGLGMRLALDRQSSHARRLLSELAPAVGPLANEILDARCDSDREIEEQRDRVRRLEEALANTGDDPRIRDLLSVAGDLVRRSVWIVGGDGWAYDIGAGGLDHVLASGRDVNVLVLDTEVYSNTGGQASKATPRAAIAKFAARGKATGKKDLGLQAIAYGNVYVAQVALGGGEMQAIRAFNEAEAWPGPSLIIAYSTCIAHGIDMAKSLSHQKDAVRSAYWPLYRYHPEAEGHPFHLDSKEPAMSFKEFAMSEARFAMLARTAPGDAERLMAEAQDDVTTRWNLYRQLAGVDRVAPHLPEPAMTGPGEDEEGA